MITFRCGRCAGVVPAGDGQAGRAITCRRCGHVNVCPAPSATRAVPRSGSRPRSSSRLIWSIVAALVLIWAAWDVWSMLRQPVAHAAAAEPAMNAADLRQQEILRQDIDKPTDPDLAELYQRINEAHFARALRAIPILWEPRLAEVGKLAAKAFTLEGMFGHLGSRTAILLNPDLKSDPRAIERALCHEMVHAYLDSVGDHAPTHGPAFQAILRRLSSEGAFEGILTTNEDRAQLRAWIDAQSARLDVEQTEMTSLAREIEDERLAVERDVAELNAGLAAAKSDGRAGPADQDRQAAILRLEIYNRHAADANVRVERDRADRDHLAHEKERYNLMLVYPDGGES